MLAFFLWFTESKTITSRTLGFIGTDAQVNLVDHFYINRSISLSHRNLCFSFSPNVIKYQAAI